MDPAQLILRIKTESIPLEEVFKDIVVYFRDCSDDEGVELLKLMRTQLDSDKDFMRMERIGVLGGDCPEFQQQTLKFFNYAVEQNISLGRYRGQGSN